MKYSDKLWHFLSCLILSAFFTLSLGWIAGLISGITAGAIKEIWDEFRYGKFDLYDFCADVLGTVLGVWIVTKFG